MRKPRQLPGPFSLAKELRPRQPDPMRNAPVHFLVALVAAVWAGPALSAPAAEPVLSSAKVREGKNERAVELQPLRPVQYLESRLPSLPEPNRQIVEIMLSYPREGQHDYWWPRKGSGVAYDGCTTDILVAGETLLKGEPQGRTFCCGLTLEVFYRALEKQPRLPEDFTTSTARQFKNLWFCREINSPGPEEAILALGVGEKITTPSQALPGDFVQLWRANRSGHSVIFVDWARNLQGEIVGLHYWSTQEGTQGIGFRTELFGESGNGVKRELLSVSRLLPAAQWTGTDQDLLWPEKEKNKETPGSRQNRKKAGRTEGSQK